MDLNSGVSLYITEYQKAFSSISKHIPALWDIINYCWTHRGTLYTCGNGGTTGILMNMTADLSIHPFTSEDKNIDDSRRKWPPLRAVNLSTDHSSITAITNDMGFEHVYSYQLDIMSTSLNDVLFAASGSGTSKNIVAAIEKAHNLGMKTILMSRNPKADIAKKTTLHIPVDITSTFPGQTGKNNANFYFEDCICAVSHIICGFMKQKVHENDKSNSKSTKKENTKSSTQRPVRTHR